VLEVGDPVAQLLDHLRAAGLPPSCRVRSVSCRACRCLRGPKRDHLGPYRGRWCRARRAFGWRPPWFLDARSLLHANTPWPWLGGGPPCSVALSHAGI
jgi:hypothetical protein